MEINELYDSFFDLGTMLKPYESDEEHLREMFRLLDLCFTVVSVARGFSGENFPGKDATGNLQGLTVASKDLAGVLLAGRTGDGYDELSQEAREQIENAFFHVACRLKKSSAKGMIPRFEVVRMKFGLSDLETFATLLALAAEYDRRYESVFVYLHNNTSDIYATPWLAVKLYGYFYHENDADAAKLLSGSSVLTRFLCSREFRKRERSESSQWLVLSRRVSAYIMGRNALDPALSGFVTLRDGETDPTEHVPVRAEQFAQAEEFFRNNAFADEGCFVLNLYGPKGVGRCYTAMRATAAVGLRILRIDLNKYYDSVGSFDEKYFDMLYTESVLVGAIPCFVYDVPLNVTDNEGVSAPSAAAARTDIVTDYVSKLFRFVFWVSPEKINISANEGTNCVGIELPMLTANERKLFWEKQLADTGLDAGSFANRYILTPLYIERACRTAAEYAVTAGRSVTSEDVIEGVKQHSVNPLGSYATRINAVFTWDDLVVSEEQKTRMKMICDQVRYRSVVHEDWGFRRKTPYGRGLCALFYGSPGTGKTMAVQVMANDLGLDVYRIDLSQLTSKYIGETQKNISRLFERAKNINAMLFFDEADSMFAKRSEVKDSNDRYANADTAFLLQKLEEHEGITILATNYVNNIDDAFKRRIKFMVNFVFPTADVRRRLWETILPAEAVKDEPLDFDFFAERFELSGSNIKEILTNAAFLAAAEGTGIRNSHIIEAVKLNFSKYGKILTNADFDYLGG